MSNAVTPEELALLRESARQALDAVSTGWPDDSWPQSWKATWTALGEHGLWSTIEPPDGSLAAAVVVAEEAGRALYPGPVCETLAATYVLHRLDDGKALSAVVEGAPAAALLTTDRMVDAGPAAIDVPLDPAVRVGDQTSLIVMAADGAVFVTPAGDTSSETMPSLDVSRDIAQLRLTGPPVRAVASPDPEVEFYGSAARRLLYCADTLGCVDLVLARTTEYACQRTTFGSPIGKYQAVAHRLVDHAITAEQMRLLLDMAVGAFDRRSEDVALRVATAETFFAGRGVDLISDCIQLCGAIGFTWEFGHHFYLRRVAANAALAGGTARPQQRLAAVAPW